MRVPAEVRPGDVLAVDTGTSAGNVAIRVGWLLKRRDWSWANHCVIAHHWTAGVFWGIEGRPGGVGWVDLTARDWRHLSHNADQPKSDDQRARVCEWAEKTILGRAYDWSAIERHALDALGVPDLFRDDWNGQGVPGQVVCSSVCALAYDQVGLSRPLPGEGGRYVAPGDWERHNRRRSWEGK